MQPGLTLLRRALLPLLALAATPALSDRLACTLQPDCPAGTPCPGAPLQLTFDIDRNQFLRPVDPADPPRRKITMVETSDGRFSAEPILMDSGIRGFWTESGGGARMLTITLDGAAIYSETAPDRRYAGTCTDIR